MKNREKIESLTSSDLQPERKRQRQCSNVDVDNALFMWFKQARAINATVSGPVMQTKAELIAAELGVVDFKASSGWLTRFKRRHGIVYKSVCGEAASVDETVVSDWQGTVLSGLLQNYAPRDIFNADETGVFFRSLPDKTHALKGEKCTGGKQSKDRLTVLVAANMDGSEKLPLLVIGKSAKPLCFSNVKSLPVDYRANRKAWMTSSIFEDWLRKLDRKFLLQGRSILMIVDNCPAHPAINGLSSIKLEFLPPNTTSHTQPCDQGIIHSFKRHYRGKVVMRLLSYINDTESATSATASNFYISVLDALYFMRWAWDRVSTETVANCFRHAGFVDPSQDNTDTNSVANDPGESAIEDLLERLQETTAVTVTAEEYVSFDTEVETTAEMSVTEIVKSMSGSGTTDPESAEEDDCECETTQVRHVSTREAKDALKTLVQYAQQHEQGEKLFTMLMSAEDAMDKLACQAKKQTSIKDFFKKKL